MKSPWAVKRITKRAIASGNTAIYNERLVKEAKILRELKHPNVIGFRGMTKDVAGRDVLALEICTTSLNDIIEFRSEEDSGPIPSTKALKVIVDIASALDYLHNTARILHGDIKSANVLINGDFEICKLCDFGVSLPLTKMGCVDWKAEPNASYIGTELWAAPEVLLEEDNDSAPLTTKTDIFSFGCTIYEMLSLTAPHLLMTEEDEKTEGDQGRALNFDMDDSENNDSMMNCTDDGANDLQTMLQLRMGTRPLLPEDIEYGQEYDRVIEMYFICTSEEPDQRPTAKNILEALKGK